MGFGSLLPPPGHKSLVPGHLSLMLSTIILIVHGASLWKYVDDTTVSEVVEKGQISFAQELVNSVED